MAVETAIAFHEIAPRQRSHTARRTARSATDDRHHDELFRSSQKRLDRTDDEVVQLRQAPRVLIGLRAPCGELLDNVAADSAPSILAPPAVTHIVTSSSGKGHDLRTALLARAEALL